jgi:hypothetical protein
MHCLVAIQHPGGKFELLLGAALVGRAKEFHWVLAGHGSSYRLTV